MSDQPTTSKFRVVKERVDAVLTLSNGQTPRGCFFVAGGSPWRAGRELVSELLNTGAGFFPFEVEDTRGPRTLLFNRNHVVMVALGENEAARDPGYSVATERTVSLLLSNGHRVTGGVRVYQPEGHHRLSDWARAAESFRYVETPEATFIVNVTHIVEVSEVTEP